MPKHKKTLIRLSGGTGNQLFQICAGLAFAERFDSHPIFDLRHTGSSHFSDLENHLDLEFLTKNRLSKSPIWAISYRVKRKVIAQLKLESLLLSEHKPREIGFNPEILKKRYRVLSGLYQTYIYSEVYDIDILSKLNMKHSSSWFNSMNDLISNENAVAIHLRRGDYAKVSEFNGLLGINYYSESMSFVLSKYKNLDLKFYVFSDDSKQAKEFFAGINQEFSYIEPPEDSCPVESLLLISQCKVQIIANSTFSWWGAYLSRNSIDVLAPSSWMKHGPNPSNLHPPSWTLINSSWQSS